MKAISNYASVTLHLGSTESGNLISSDVCMPGMHQYAENAYTFRIPIRKNRPRF